MHTPPPAFKVRYALHPAHWTATTFLQEWLYASKVELSSRGVFLSTVAKEGNNRRLVSWLQSNVDDWLRHQGVAILEQEAELLQGFEAQFRAEMAAASQHHHTVVLTSEHFHSRLHTDEEIARVKALTDNLFDSTTVVCYFRDQADMTVSLHSTLQPQAQADRRPYRQPRQSRDTTSCQGSCATALCRE